MDKIWEDKIWNRIIGLQDRIEKASYASAYAVTDSLEKETEKLFSLLKVIQEKGKRDESH